MYERKSESSVGVRYGEYEADDGGRRIGNSLLRDLLLQCRGVLGMLKVSTNRPDDSSPGYLSPDAFSEGNCFHQIILAHEGTVEGYLRALVIE